MNKEIKVIRGAGWMGFIEFLRSACRAGIVSNDKMNYPGFRVVRNIPIKFNRWKAILDE